MKYRVSKIFSAVVTWASRINTKAMQEDFRKAGLILVGAGYAGVIIGGDKISNLEGFLLLATGLVLWVIGITQEEEDVS